MHISKLSPFQGPALEITVVRRAHIQAFSRKNCTHVFDSLVRTSEKLGSRGTSTRADASAFTSEPQLSSYRRRYQTGETPEKLAHMFRLLGPCLDTLLTRCHTHVGLLGPCFKPGENRENIAHMLDSGVRVPPDTPEKLAFMLDSFVRVSQQERWKNQKKKLVFRSVTVWEPGTGGEDVKTRSSRSQFLTRRHGHSAELAGAHDV